MRSGRLGSASAADDGTDRLQLTPTMTETQPDTTNVLVPKVQQTHLLGASLCLPSLRCL